VLGTWSLPPEGVDPWQWPWGVLMRRDGDATGPGLEPGGLPTGETTRTPGQLTAEAWQAVAELDRILRGQG
jgi:hypothetical protein